METGRVPRADEDIGPYKRRRDMETGRVPRADEDMGPYGMRQERNTEKGRSDGECHSDHMIFLRAQRRNEVSQEVLCQAFFQESGQSCSQLW